MFPHGGQVGTACSCIMAKLLCLAFAFAGLQSGDATTTSGSIHPLPAGPSFDANVTVSTLAAGGGAGGRKCVVPGYRDGPAAQALFNLPARLQAVADPGGGERLYIFDIHNGCVRSLPLGVAAAATVVRSETPCGAGSTLAHVGPDARFANGTSRGWRWIDGPLSFKVARDGATIWAMDTYANQLKVATRGSPSNSSPFGPWRVVAGSGDAGTVDGPGATATFYQPHGMDVAEAAGVAYVADTFSSCIRSVELASGAVTTIAGECGQGGHRDAAVSGSALDARFNHVHKVTVDPRNESVLYVSEVECSDDGPLGLADRCRSTAKGQYFAGVRRLELKPDGSVASVTTTAGTGVGFADGDVSAAKFHYVHDVAMRPVFNGSSNSTGGAPGSTTELFVMDDNNNRVRRVDLSTNTVSTVAGSGGYGCADGAGSKATFANAGAVGLAVGRDGTVYVADYGNHRIRMVKMAS